MRPGSVADEAEATGAASRRPPRTGRDRSRHRGTLRGLMPHAWPFLARHRRALLRLGAWSLMESAQTFLVGICLARALDQGFLAGQPTVGLAWLAVAAGSILLAGPVLRGVFGQLSGLVEPLRDGLVRRAVGQALRRAVADPARAAGAERAAVSRLTQQTEIARDSFAGLVLTVRSFLFTAVGALAGMLTLAPELLLVVVPPMLLGLVLFLLTLAPMAAAQRRFLDADEAFTDRAGVLRSQLRDLVACGATGAAVDEAGERIAIVGPSGIGKSTLAHVLSGLHAPDEGAVRLAGRPVDGRPPRELARMRVLLPQQGYVFAGSVRENLAQLEPGAGDDRISQAVAALHLGPLVDRLGGLGADVDPRTLSAGERQALCLGRAYVSPAPLLILDESTCHLDPAAEAHAEEALAARPGTTLIVIAHRLSSALRADRILVLDGAGTAFGTHESLLRDSPLYRDLTGHWNASG